MHHHPEDPMEAYKWEQECAADARLTPPDPTAPLDIACKCKATVRLTLTQTLKTAGVWKGTCAVCGLMYSRQEPMAASA